MQKLLSHGSVAVGIALSCGITFVNTKAVAMPQFVVPKMERETLISQSAVEEESNIKFESRGCRRIKPEQVTCDVLVTNIGEKRQGLRFGVYGPTKAIDSSGTVYDAQRVQSGGSFADIDPSKSNGTACGCFSLDLATGIPTKVTFTFKIPPEVTELAALDVDFGWSKDNASMWGGKKIAISNIGTIAAQSNSVPPRQRVKPR